MDVKDVFEGQVRGLKQTLDLHFKSRDALDRACSELTDAVSGCVAGWAVRGLMDLADSPLHRPAWAQDYHSFREAVKRLGNLRESWGVYSQAGLAAMIRDQELEILHMARRLAHALSEPGAVSPPSSPPPRGPVRPHRNGSAPR